MFTSFVIPIRFVEVSFLYDSRVDIPESYHSISPRLNVLKGVGTLIEVQSLVIVGGQSR